jgi:ABC-type transport system involved in cytochrome bd biosynthesis fused ATPase/permease subunit
MDGGRIIEQGTHPELLDHNGYYARLWALQQEKARQELAGDEPVSRLA